MRTLRRAVCAAVVTLTLVLPALPVGAEPEADAREVTPFGMLWELVGELWSSFSPEWAGSAMGQAATAPAEPTSTAEEPCTHGCGERGVAIDPNG